MLVEINQKIASADVELPSLASLATVSMLNQGGQGLARGQIEGVAGYRHRLCGEPETLLHLQILGKSVGRSTDCLTWVIQTSVEMKS